MNNRVVVLRRAVEQLIQILTGKDIPVTQRGTSAYVASNKRTHEPIQVNLPYVPDDASEEFIDALHGFLDHEGGHLLFTDFKVVSEANRGGKRLAKMHNVIEDTFIERKMAERFKGSAENLDNVGRFYLMDSTIDDLLANGDMPNAVGAILVPAFRALAGQEIFQKFMDDKGYWPLIQTMLDKIKHHSPKLLDSLPHIQNSAEALDIARNIHTAIKEDKPEMPESDNKEEGDQPGDGDGDSDENEENKSEEPEAGGESESENEPKEEENEETENESGTKNGSDSDGEPAEDEPEKDESDEEADEDSDSGSSSAEPDNDDSGDNSSDPEPDPVEEEEEEEEEDESKGESGESDDDDSGEEGNEESSGGSDGDSDPDDSESDDSGGGDSSDDPVEDESESESESGDDSSGGSGDEKGKESEESDGGGIGAPEEIPPEVEEGLDHMPDFDDSVCDSLSKNSHDMGSVAKYLPFTKDYDIIEPVEVGGDYMDSYLEDLNDMAAEAVGPLQKTLERLIQAQSKRRWQAGLRSGRVNSGSLYRLKTGDDRVFRKREISRTKEVAMTLLVDNSGSMSGKEMQTAMVSAYAMSQALDKIGVTHEVIGFTTKNMRLSADDNTAIEEEERAMGRKFSRYEPIYMPIYKAFEERLGVVQKQRIAYSSARQGFLRNNIDGESIEYAAQRLMRQREPGKIICVLSDGNPAAYGDPSALNKHLKDTVKDLNKRGIQTFGIGINDESVRRYYDHCVVLNDVNQLPGEIMKDLKKFLLG